MGTDEVMDLELDRETIDKLDKCLADLALGKSVQIKVSQERVLYTIRPNDLAPDISKFQHVTDELKPKPNGNGKARNGHD